MIVTAMFLIVGGDAAGTILTSAGFPQVFVAWTRFALAAILLAPFCSLRMAELPKFVDWRLILRAAFIMGGIICILTALKTEPMANVFGGFSWGLLSLIFCLRCCCANVLRRCERRYY